MPVLSSFYGIIVRMYREVGGKHKRWFGLLADKNYFKTVRILPDGLGIEWRDGQDIAPHELYELSQKIN